MGRKETENTQADSVTETAALRLSLDEWWDRKQGRDRDSMEVDQSTKHADKWGKWMQRSLAQGTRQRSAEAQPHHHQHHQHHPPRATSSSTSSTMPSRRSASSRPSSALPAAPPAQACRQGHGTGREAPRQGSSSSNSTSKQTGAVQDPRALRQGQQQQQQQQHQRPLQHPTKPLHQHLRPVGAPADWRPARATAFNQHHQHHQHQRQDQSRIPVQKPEFRKSSGAPNGSWRPPRMLSPAEYLQQQQTRHHIEVIREHARRMAAIQEQKRVQQNQRRLEEERHTQQVTNIVKAVLTKMREERDA